MIYLLHKQKKIKVDFQNKKVKKKCFLRIYFLEFYLMFELICKSKMTTLRQFTCDDLFRFNPVNLDPLTETYGVGFYLQYLARWPEYFLVAESPSNDLMGYIMGKSEGIFK